MKKSLGKSEPVGRRTLAAAPERSTSPSQHDSLNRQRGRLWPRLQQFDSGGDRSPGWATAATAIGVALVGVVAGIPRSPIVPELPPGAAPLAPFRWAARISGMASLGSGGRVAAAAVAVGIADAGFLIAARQAWHGRVSVRTVVWFAVAFHAAVLAMPLLISNDVYHYSMYGRIASIHHANPYVATPADFPSDPLFRFVTSDWRHVPAFYGPAFVQLAAALTRLIRSPAGLIWTFKLISATASVLAMLVGMRLARQLRPERAAFGAILIGWNPIVLFNLVGGGHVDALIGLAVVLALALTVAAKASIPESGRDFAYELGATGVLTVAALFKAPAVPPLILAVAASAWSRPRGRRKRLFLAHIAVIAALVAVFAGPFLQASDKSLGSIQLSSYTNFLAPSSFVRFVVTTIVSNHALAKGLTGGVGLLFAVTFLVAFGLIASQVVARARTLPALGQGSAWAWIMLLFSLAAPILWPWYLMWFLPLAWLLPRQPRRVVMLMAVALSLSQIVILPTRGQGAYQIVTGLGRFLLAPILLIGLFQLVKDLRRRLSAQIPLEAEM